MFRANLLQIPINVFLVLLSFLLINSNLFAGVTMPPMNNECSMAIGPIALNTPTPGTTTNSTMTAGTPNAGFCGTTHSTSDVWYTVIGTGNTMTASTCNNANYDTKISIFCDECNQLICITGNDDGIGCAGFTSQISWASSAGVEYLVMMHGFGTATGDFTLTITDDGMPSMNQVACPGGMVAICGDGNLDPGEECDDGNILDGDGCQANCMLPICGDGIVDPNEQCDDGNNIDGDGCEADCSLLPPSVETDADPYQLYSYFDLRNRESFIQVTNTDPAKQILHIQIFDVSNNCNENNFFDDYTINDTHVYNIRDIQTNDGDPSGVALPANAYGFVVVTAVMSEGGPSVTNAELIGNFRILDNTGYEYRTNSLGITEDEPVTIDEFTFNYNTKGNITHSDIVGININQNSSNGEVEVSPLDANTVFDIDIFNNNEVAFSCRDVAFACVDEDNPLLEQLLENESVNVARFEYGINNSLPHSKDGELLCPGNVIDEGIVRLLPISSSADVFTGYVGLNSGNDRGSMDSFWSANDILLNLMQLMNP